MKSLHRILPALCAATLCLFLPAAAACSTSGNASSERSVPRIDMPADRPPFPAPDGVPYPLPHDGDPDLLLPDGIPAPRPRPVTPSRPSTSGDAENIPSPYYRHRRGRRSDSYRRDSEDCRDKDDCSSCPKRSDDSEKEDSTAEDSSARLRPTPREKRQLPPSRELP